MKTRLVMVLVVVFGAACARSASTTTTTTTTTTATTAASALPTLASAGVPSPATVAATSTVPETSTAGGGPSASSNAPRPLWTASEPPAGGASARGAQWVRFPGPAGTQMYAAVFRPSGSGPFPAVIFLHGTEGLRRTHEVEVAADVAATGGLVTVAACWFAGSWNVTGPNFSQFVPVTYADGIACPDAPPVPLDATASAPQAALAAIVEMTRTLPDVDAKRVGLFGHSRGSNAVVGYGVQTGGVSGVVAAAGYPALTPDMIHARPSMLVLQGTADQQTPVDVARRFETALRAGRFPIESNYYEGGAHDLYYVTATHGDVVARIAAFFKR